MGNKVPLKTGMLIYLPVTSPPLIYLQKEAVLSPCNFATTHLTACILSFYLSFTSRPTKRSTLSQHPNIEKQGNEISTVFSFQTPLWPQKNKAGIEIFKREWFFCAGGKLFMFERELFCFFVVCALWVPKRKEALNFL